MKRYIIFLAVLLISGCAKMTGLKIGGDDQLVKGEIKTANIKGIENANAQGVLNAQLGMINKTLTDMRQTKSGRDSIMNDPKMIEKFIMIFGIVIGLPFLTLLLVFIIYILSTERRYKQNVDMLKSLINNVSDSLDKLIDKENIKDSSLP